MKYFHLLISAFLLVWSSTTVSGPDPRWKLYTESQEETAIILRSHIINGYRIDLLSPMILTKYIGSAHKLPYQGEGYHGTFISITDYRGEVVYFNRDEGTGKIFIFDVDSVEDKAEDNDIDIGRADIVVREVQSGANGPCVIRYYAFELKEYAEFLGRWCRG